MYAQTTIAVISIAASMIRASKEGFVLVAAGSLFGVGSVDTRASLTNGIHI